MLESLRVGTSIFVTDRVDQSSVTCPMGSRAPTIGNSTTKRRHAKVLVTRSDPNAIRGEGRKRKESCRSVSCNNVIDHEAAGQDRQCSVQSTRRVNKLARKVYPSNREMRSVEHGARLVHVDQRLVTTCHTEKLRWIGRGQIGSVIELP